MFVRNGLIFVSFLVLVLRAGGQDKVTIYSTSSGKNEIEHEPIIKTKSGKFSSKPVLVIKEPKYESKTSISDIKERAKEKSNELIENEVPDKPHEVPTLKGLDIVIEKTPSLICPPRDAPRPLFALPCITTKNCGFLGGGMLCCDNRCLKGVRPPKAEPHHEPIFFGIIQRKCPVNPLTELSEVKECFTDEECSPRICCGETLQNGKSARYCRTPIPIWDTLPLPSPVLEPLKTLTSYMQCTPPPPPHLDLYPKPCQNPMDCFPSLCCQEKGKKFCRPPKRSLLALVADLGQRIIPEDTARKFIERIS